MDVEDTNVSPQTCLPVGDGFPRVVKALSAMRNKLQPFERLLICEKMLLGVAATSNDQDIEAMLEHGRREYKRLMDLKRSEVPL